MSQWRHTESDFAPRDYVCAFCNRHVAASNGYWQINEHGSVVSTIAICPNCQSPTYFQRHTTQIPAPPFGAAVSNIKDRGIEALYEEARRCTSHGAFTGAVMLCRKLLMNIAVQKGAAENQPFKDYVDYLNQKGYVPPDGKQWVDAIRTKGNEANHEIQLMSEKDARNVLRFTEMLLRFIFEMPAMFQN